MRYLKTYDQINESKGSDILLDLLEKFSSKIDVKKLNTFINEHIDLLMPYYKKYCKDGVVDSDLIYSDFSKFNFTANESFYNDDYADDSDNNPILRFLYKIFVRWPKDIIKFIWELFEETVIGTWENNKVVSILIGIVWVGVSILVFMLGTLIYQLTDHSINGLDKGKIKTEQFEPGHYEMVAHHVFIGKVLNTYYVKEYIGDRWFVEVVGEDGREEIWCTYNRNVGETIDPGQEIVNDDNWAWQHTEKK